ncbi:hypothetical protein QYZ88_006375 [Lachnospiraceae bacterium C1.1]|nr:hypothetical protein [Lachnospiraceae bacterium C1.1]
MEPGFIDNLKIKKMSKRLKRFIFKQSYDYIVYLQKIISITQICLDKLKRYNIEISDTLTKYEGKKLISYELYADLKDKTSSEITYLVNVIGDSSCEAVSYFNYRKYVKVNKFQIKYTEFSMDTQKILEHFKSLRNWINHIPASLINSDKDFINQGYEQPYIINPIEIYMNQYVTVELLRDLYNENLLIYGQAKKIFQMCKKDYSLLIGESVIIRRIYADEPLDVYNKEIVIIAAIMQGLYDDI